MNLIATDKRDVLFLLSKFRGSAPEDIEKSLFDAYRNGLGSTQKACPRTSGW
jgi:hypothetical protein